MLRAICIGLAEQPGGNIVIPVGVVPLTVVEILQRAAVAPVQTRGAPEGIDRRHTLAQRVVGKKCPAVFPILVVGEIKDARPIRALVGKLLGRAVRIGDLCGAVERIVVHGEGESTGLGHGSCSAIEIRGEAGAIRCAREGAIDVFKKAACRIVIPSKRGQELILDILVFQSIKQV